MAGLDATGVTIKTVQDLVDEISQEMKDGISPTLDTEPDQPTGVAIGIFSSKLAEVWELGQAINANQDPDTASGFGLTATAALTGTNRHLASKSVAKACVVNVDPGTYAAGTLVAHTTGDPTARFVNRFDVVNGGGGAADVDADFIAEVTGPVRANAGDLTEIASPVGGWNSITNPTDAILGKLVESDTELRARRVQDNARRGSTTAEALRVDLRDITVENGYISDVTSISILENETDAVDGNGLPPHSVEAIVLGGDDDEVAAVVFEGKAAGIQTYGNTSVVYTDSEGVDHTVNFTRPVEKLIYLEIHLAGLTATYGGDTLVKEDVSDFGAENYSVGDDVILSRVSAVTFQVPGVTDVTQVKVGIVHPPLGVANYAIGVREVARLDTGRIDVVATLT